MKIHDVFVNSFLAVSALLLARSPAIAQPALDAPITTQILNVLKPPPGTKVLFTAETEEDKSWQIYECKQDEKDPNRTAWNLKGPDATLIGAAGQEIIKHSFGPAWTWLADGSAVTAAIEAKVQPDSNAAPWLLLGEKAHTGNGVMIGVKKIQRIVFEGGLPPALREGFSPARPCTPGEMHSSPYRALYIFSGPE